jgi:hypothetical protein
LSNAARLAWIGAAALGVFVIWLATGASASAGIGFFYALPIALAAWWGGRQITAITVVGCVVLYVTGALIHPVSDFGLVLALRLVIFVGVAIAVLAARERFSVLEHSAEELEDIQAALTPTKIVELPHVDVGTAFVPADHSVSSDFYLVTNGPDDSTVALLGDVVGHGPEAARWRRSSGHVSRPSPPTPATLPNFSRSRTWRSWIDRALSMSWSGPPVCGFRPSPPPSPGQSQGTHRRCACLASKSSSRSARPSCSAQTAI